MAMFKMGSKEAGADKQGPATGTPTDLVVQMRRQGVSNNQIIQNLQRMGYKSHNIFDAMNQADIKGGVEGAQLEPMPQGIENPVQGYGYQPSFEPPQFQQPPSSGESSTHKIEELAEAIIDEKWEELVKNLNKIAEWKTETDNRISSMEQELKDLKEQFKDLHTGVLGKAKEYDQNITNVGAQLIAMEKMFQKVTPVFTQNINELSRITDKLKKSSK